ncbi:hypothetical protein NSK_002713 [Nannochloropsis salina CCMP1776]|uniref:Major facilitator superfamily (MFS) profile domain-containing protein n=1 Tax=Nannochloropsis salina CCMP1776 TaxID=1027361 RepID=A0A4D9D7A7_9STRA|nr:hypothetical protein NSK_002713 [Nannochloropsis salina CCMP1776]|eukprot:TFJ85893.1 hypothetical protein NSK_002713 [Nannochloropsis salina CCMP1776]
MIHFLPPLDPQLLQRSKATAAQAVANAFVASTLTWLLWSLDGVLAGSLFVDIFYPQAWHVSEHRLLRTLSYLSRPLGAVLFGHLGDTWGRTKTLTVCLTVMGLASGCMALLPTHQVWGWASWYLLLVLHALQGLAVGGQWGGCLLLAYEFCRHDRHKGLVSSLPQAGRALGYMLTALISASLDKEKPPTAGTPSGGTALHLADNDLRWRWAHGFAAGLLLLALHLRLRIPEPREFRYLKKHRRLRAFPLFQALRAQLWNIIWALGALWVDGVTQVMVVGWGLPALLTAHGISMETLLTSLAIAVFVQAVFIVVGGWLGDRLGRRKLFFVASMSMALGTVFYFYALFRLSSPSRAYPIYLANILYLGIAYGTLQGVFPALLVEIFPENVRFSGVAVLYQVSRLYSSVAWPYASQALLRASRGARFKFLALENGENLTGLAIFVASVAGVSAMSVLMIQIYSSGGRGEGVLPFPLVSRRSKVREYIGGGIQHQLQQKEEIMNESREEGGGGGVRPSEEVEGSEEGEGVGLETYEWRGSRRGRRPPADGVEEKLEPDTLSGLEGGEGEMIEEDDYSFDEEEYEEDEEDSAGSVFSDFDEPHMHDHSSDPTYGMENSTYSVARHV